MDSRVIHIDSGAEWRGGQRQLYLLALEQRARGTEPLVVGQPRSRLVLRLRSAGVASAGVRMRGNWDLNAARRIRRLIRMWHPPVVHVHDARSWALARKALVGMTSVALVVHCRTIPRQRHLVGGSATAPQTGNRASRFVAPSSAIVKFLTGSGIPAASIDRVPPAVATPREVRARSWRGECRWPRSAIVCGVIGESGSLVDAQLLAILARLPENVTAQLRFVILGGSGEGTISIGGTTAFSAGFVDDMSSAIAGCDLFSNFSGAESMGTAVLDALALGVPVVTFGAGGAGEYVEHGKSGLVVESGDTVAFADALSSLVQNDELRDTMASFGPGRAAAFSIAEMTDAVDAVYARAMQEVTLVA